MMNEKKANGDPQKNAAHDEQQITNQGKSVAVYIRKHVPDIATFEEQQESLTNPDTNGSYYQALPMRFLKKTTSY